MYNYSSEESLDRVLEVYNATRKSRFYTNRARKRVLVKYYTLIMLPRKGSLGRVRATISKLFSVLVSFSLFVALAFLSNY